MIAFFDQKTWWFLSRSSGIVAMALVIASLVWGVMLVTKLSRKPGGGPRPAWTLDVHKWLSGLAFCAVVLHLLGLYLDDYLTFGPRELFVPGASDYRPYAVGVGVLSLYGLLAVQGTAMLRRFLPRRLWHGVHMVSYLVAWGGLMHAGLAGTDTRHRAYQILAGVMALVLVVAIIVRLVAPKRPGRAASSRAARSSSRAKRQPGKQPKAPEQTHTVSPVASVAVAGVDGDFPPPSSILNSAN